MPEEIKPIRADPGGYDVITDAVLALLTEYGKLLDPPRDIYFEDINKTGIAFSADDGALIYTETQDVLGGYTQNCQYPFYVVYRIASTAEKQKLYAQRFLDTMGKWLCMEPAEINGVTHHLTQYPELNQGRRITRITRFNSYGLDPNEDGVQDWLLPVTVHYINEIPPEW